MPKISRIKGKGKGGDDNKINDRDSFLSAFSLPLLRITHEVL